MKILLPVDGSDYTKRMLAYVAGQGELLGPNHQYTLFTVVPALPPHAARHIDRASLDAYYREQADEVLQAAKAYAEQQGLAVQVDSRIGHAADAIAAYAQSGKHDLIVMGSQGHAALASLVLGSVTRGVLACCTVPVLLIR
jgi:nucleotide-binding universal stress UspA family protein